MTAGENLLVCFSAGTTIKVESLLGLRPILFVIVGMISLLYLVSGNILPIYGMREIQGFVFPSEIVLNATEQTMRNKTDIKKP